MLLVLPVYLLKNLYIPSSPPETFVRYPSVLFYFYIPCFFPAAACTANRQKASFISLADFISTDTDRMPHASAVICRSFFAIRHTSSFPASPHRYSSRSSARKDAVNTIPLSRSIFRQRWRHSSSIPSFLYSLKYEYRTSSVTPYRLNRSVTLCCVEG